MQGQYSSTVLFSLFFFPNTGQQKFDFWCSTLWLVICGASAIAAVEADRFKDSRDSTPIGRILDEITDCSRRATFNILFSEKPFFGY